MKKESLKNRRLIAIIIVVVLLLVSAFSDGIISKITRGKVDKKKEDTVVKGKIGSIGEKTLTEEVIEGSDSSNRILIIPINGVIAGDETAFLAENYNHNAILKILDGVRDDDSIKGIIFDINSPGGTVYHSAELWNAIRNVQEEFDIPIYTSMGSVAASGGYYIAAPSDKIFAAEETMTGSIGVIADYINYSGLENKLGIKHNVIKSSEHKDIGSPSREMTGDEREILQNTIDSSYNRFIKVVSEGREMPEDQVRAIADGRVYNGIQARDNGLVDEIGYLGDAINHMSEELGLKDPEIFRKSPNTIDRFSNILGVNISNLLDRNTSELDILRELKENYGINNTPQILYIYGGH